ncbi:oxidoreductase [Roseivirga misakiensis]|uniref:Short-chain dehydrogenase/reductase n=1 Tax=Roseivirga misakiensis TaxID=1563681 RepID=A0A1E5T7A7_9BACT|nr:oxidoreductase [Roseivirga misakiensis]OEK07265.1 short-chain dehydrogenase/reductase [Roseivirga misakiensis]
MNQIETNKVWFITGASAGFGKAFAEYAISQNYNVVVTARRVDKLTQLEGLAPKQVLALRMDVNDNSQIEEAVDKGMKRFGQIDVLINNAGYGTVGALEETPEDELRAQMETNFFGAIAVTKAILPHMRDQKSGAIVNMSSMGGQMSFGGFGPYSASKFALEGASEALAQEVAPFGIKVMIVEPGAFRTDFAGSALKHMPEMDAYKEIVGGTREFAQGMDQTQEGDPAKAAIAIDKALAAENTPLRLQLGEDSINAIKEHSENLLSELKAWESIGLDTKMAD